MTRVFRIFAVLLLTVGAVFAIAGALHVPNTTIPLGFPGQHVMVKQVPIRVLQQGTGRDVLLIHGSPGSVEDWAPVMGSIGDSMHLTAFDRPGNGYSGDTRAYSPEDNADIALALIDVLRLEHVVVVGHSYGGATALAMAARAPIQVDAFVIVDSAAYEPSRKPDPVLRLLDVPLFGQGAAMFVGPILAPRKIRKGILEQFGNHPPGEDFIALRTRIWSTPKVTHAIAVETLDHAKNLRLLASKYRSIRKPVFILAEADNSERRASAERLHGDIAGSTLELLSGAGHYLQFEKTADVVCAIVRAAQAR